jgi:hypothetical protein
MGGVDVYIQSFFISALIGGGWSASRLCRFTPGERAPGTHWIGGWVSPRDGLDTVERRKFLTLPGLELRPLGRPTRSQSLYRLRYHPDIDYSTHLSVFLVRKEQKRMRRNNERRNKAKQIDNDEKVI